ncbi:MAG TPA: hypothetical protein DGG94_09330 [Micromonosporaceae bacterium]|nr:hypothetical protein [Micromonosporaceae bacterium]
MTTVYFGARWDSPLLDGDVRQTPTPVGQVCYACKEKIIEGDRGVVRGCVRMVDGKPVASAEPVHTECDLRDVMGHQLGVCPCNGHGIDRAAGRLTLERLNELRASQGMGPM